jgi:hypothetical protein
MSDVNQLVNQLYEELTSSGFLGVGGCNDELVVQKLGEAKGQMGELKQVYAQQHPGEPLEDALYDKLNEKWLREALPLYYEVPSPRPVSSQGVDDPEWASRLYNAFHPSGLFNCTDEDALMLVLREAYIAGQMGVLDELFHEQYPGEKGLEESLYSELSGNELKNALKLYYEGLAKENQGDVADTGYQNSSSTLYDYPFRRIDGTIVPGILRSASGSSGMNSTSGPFPMEDGVSSSTQQPEPIPSEEENLFPMSIRLQDRSFNTAVYAVKPFEFTAQGQTCKGISSSDGVVECNVPEGTTEVTIRMTIGTFEDGSDDIREWIVSVVTELPPVNTLCGMLMRLHNLGYYESTDCSILDEEAQIAIRWFQCDNSLEENGDPNDGPTQEKLTAAHDA